MERAALALPSTGGALSGPSGPLWLRHNEKDAWAFVPTTPLPSEKPQNPEEELLMMEARIRARQRLQRGGALVGSAVLSRDGTLRPTCTMRRPCNRPKS
ncbi:MAG: hypothetical protein A2V83_08455 [Nitrospirae bacterium RBG_16_64_22]|nr:MAG: hypothetical protein A2V83_08455 [Nitrospirae bacterium RBG_16_64_22]